MAPRAAIKTLGCKLNQYESEQIREHLAALGCEIVPFESQADVYVINSCTVTSRTDRDCRRLIRHAKKLNPQAFVAVTGCYAEVDAETLEAIPEADIVVPNAGKLDIANTIRANCSDLFSLADSATCAAASFDPKEHIVTEFGHHTRAFVKVQEGCNARCTYCIIPDARGPSRSTPLEYVLEQSARLIDAGHPEIVLIGTHLGQYGRDIPGCPDLVGLMGQVCELPGLGRVRLSSIEPMEIPDELLELVAGHPQVCRYLHIPMQSGCDEILRRMNRPYESAFYADLAHRIHASDPGICIGADVIVGFPGETEQQAEATYALTESLPLSYLHVFTYSIRPGTPAAEMPGQVRHEIKIARNHRLRDLSERKRAAFAQSMVDQVLEAALERTVVGEPGLLDGVTNNYLRVHVPGPETALGNLRNVRITGANEGVLQGTLLATGA